MPISPQKLREIVFLFIYSADFGNSDDEEMIKLLMRELSLSKTVVRLAQEEKIKVQEKQEEIDALISECSQSYDFERIPRIERNILRLGVYELFHSPKVPPKVAIAEAIRLCRKFATPEAATFVNAILDAIYQILYQSQKIRSHLSASKPQDSESFHAVEI